MTLPVYSKRTRETKLRIDQKRTRKTQPCNKQIIDASITNSQNNQTNNWQNKLPTILQNNKTNKFTKKKHSPTYKTMKQTNSQRNNTHQPTKQYTNKTLATWHVLGGII